MVLLKFKDKTVTESYDKLTLDEIHFHEANRVIHAKFGTSAVYRGYTFLGYSQLSPLELMRALGWSL